MVESLTWESDAAVSSPTHRWRYQLDDHLGTSTGEVTEEGLEIGWEEYHPYGTTALWSFDSSRQVRGKLPWHLQRLADHFGATPAWQ